MGGEFQRQRKAPANIQQPVDKPSGRFPQQKIKRRQICGRPILVVADGLTIKNLMWRRVQYLLL